MVLNARADTQQSIGYHKTNELCFTEEDENVRVTNGNGDRWEKVNSISNEKQSTKHRQTLSFRPPITEEFSCNASDSFVISMEKGDEIIYKVRLRGLAKGNSNSNN